MKNVLKCSPMNLFHVDEMSVLTDTFYLITYTRAFVHVSQNSKNYLT